MRRYEAFIALMMVLALASVMMVVFLAIEAQDLLAVSLFSCFSLSPFYFIYKARRLNIYAKKHGIPEENISYSRLMITGHREED